VLFRSLLDHLATIAQFFALPYANDMVVSRDGFGVVSQKWQWVTINFRLVIFRPKHRSNHVDGPSGH
jgi:hypothetical protein